MDTYAAMRHGKTLKKADAMLYWLGFIALIGILCFVGFWNLGEADVRRFDEARHAVNGYEMHVSGNKLVTTYRWEADTWNAKPPMSAWLIDLFFDLFGVSAFSMRAYSAAAVVLCAAAAAVFVLRRYGRLESLFTLLAVACSEILIEDHFMRTADADALYVLFFTLAMLCMLNTDRNLKWYYGSAFFFGCAFLTKSFHAAAIPVICFVHAYRERHLTAL